MAEARASSSEGGKSGVQLVYNPEEAQQAAAGMLGDVLVSKDIRFQVRVKLSEPYLTHVQITKQTGKAGRICNEVMITERKYTRKEFYIAFMNERAYVVRKVA